MAGDAEFSSLHRSSGAFHATGTTGFIAGEQRGPVLGPITSFAEFLQALGKNPTVVHRSSGFKILQTNRFPSRVLLRE